MYKKEVACSVGLGFGIGVKAVKCCISSDGYPARRQRRSSAQRSLVQTIPKGTEAYGRNCTIAERDVIFTSHAVLPEAALSDPPVRSQSSASAPLPETALLRSGPYVHATRGLLIAGRLWLMTPADGVGSICGHRTFV